MHVSKSKAAVSSFVSNTDTCLICAEPHFVTKCPRFLELSSKARHSTAKRLGLCLNCLRLGHRLKNCKSAGTCRECKSKHHTLLHFEYRSRSPGAHVDTGDSSTSEVSAGSRPQNDRSFVMMTSVFESSSVAVLLSTVQAETLDIHGKPFRVRILLDSASQLNFVTENCMQQGGYRRGKHCATILAVGGTKAATTRGKTSLIRRW